MSKITIGVLLGDPSGVGSEIIAKAISEGSFKRDNVRFIIIGNYKVLERGFHIIGKEFKVPVIDDYNNIESNKDLVFYNIGNFNLEEVPLGKVNKTSGESSLAQLDLAVKLYKEKVINGFTFAPLNKAALIMANMNCASEHEYFTKLFGVKQISGELNKVGNLWTTRVTSHVPISEVSKHITTETVEDSIMLAYNTIKRSGVENPKIGVSALNPHCGESGKCGREEIEIIEPLISKLKGENMNIEGPISSDIAFIRGFKGEFDSIVTMYHDQGQIALKLMSFDEGVTIAGGLPAPITTPAHGTAFDIAGSGSVKIRSFNNALNLIINMCEN